MADVEDIGFDPNEKRDIVKPLWYFEVESAYIKWKDDIEKEEQADRSVGVHASLEVGSVHRQTSGVPGEEPRPVSKLEAELSQSRHRINEGSTRVVNYLGEVQQVLASQDRFRKGEGREHVRRRYGNQHGRQLAGEWICRRPSPRLEDSLSTSTSDMESSGTARTRGRKTKNLFINVSVGDSDPLLSYSAYHTDLLRVQTGQKFFQPGTRESGSSKVPSNAKPYSIPTLQPVDTSGLGVKRTLKDAGERLALPRER